MNINTTVGGVHITLSDARLQKNLKNAQKKLNMQIVADCTPLVPFQNGALRGSVNYPQGIDGGEIEWNTPYAHYLYEGIVYGPNIPIKDRKGNVTGWWSPPVKHPTGRAIEYHHPGTTGHWFDEAKRVHLNEWVDLVKKEARKP